MIRVGKLIFGRNPPPHFRLDSLFLLSHFYVSGIRTLPPPFIKGAVHKLGNAAKEEGAGETVTH